MTGDGHDVTRHPMTAMTGDGDQGKRAHGAGARELWPRADTPGHVTTLSALRALPCIDSMGSIETGP